MFGLIVFIIFAIIVLAVIGGVRAGIRQTKIENEIIKNGISKAMNEKKEDK